MTPPRIVLITDPAYGDRAILTTIDEVATALPPGALAVQVRDKSRPRTELAAFAASIAIIAARTGTLLVINGDPEIAHAVGAPGIHLGARTMSVAEARSRGGPGVRWVSVAAHSDDDVRAASTSGADAALVSPIFAVPGKSAPRGLHALEAARALAPRSLAIYALGGIDAPRAAACRSAGAEGVAVVRALLGASDPKAEARALHDALMLGS